MDVRSGRQACAAHEGHRLVRRYELARADQDFGAVSVLGDHAAPMIDREDVGWGEGWVRRGVGCGVEGARRLGVSTSI